MTGLALCGVLIADSYVRCAERPVADLAELQHAFDDEARIEVSGDVLARLMQVPTSEARVGIDLEAQSLTLPDGAAVRFDIPEFSRYCLLHDTDEMSFLLEADADIAGYERDHPSAMDTTRLRTSA